MNAERLDAYLDALEAPMTGLSGEARREWREEARQHLVSMAEAYEELGVEPEQALEQAMLQFGDAQRIGRSLNRQARGPISADLLWGLAGFSWNVLAFATLFYGLTLTDSAQPHFWVQCGIIAAFHLVCAAALARLPRRRPSPLALAVPFAPYLLLNLLMTWAGLSQRMSPESAGEFLGGIAINWTALLAAAMWAQGWRLELRRPETETQLFPA